MKQYSLLPLLLGSTCLGGLAIATPAWAQDATNQPGTQSPGAGQSTTAGPEAGTPASPVPTNNANAGTGDQEIVVTGTLFRRTNTETPSPVTTLSAESLA